MKKYIHLFLLALWFSSSICFAHVSEHYVNVKPDLKLRVVKVDRYSSQAPKNVIILLPGRASFYEKNQDFVEILSGKSDIMTQDQQPPIANPFRSLNADVWVVDYRAHGKSDGRLGVNDQRCHIQDFQDYLSDLNTVLTKLIIPNYQNQPVRYYLMGSSMGGHIALRYVQDYQHPFAKVLLVVPMFDFKTDPWPKWVARTIIQGSRLIGRGSEYAIGYGDFNLAKQAFNREKSHHNRLAFDETNNLLKNNPQLITSGPTNDWVSAAFVSCETLMNRNAMKQVTIPVEIFAAGEDHQVENAAMIEAQKLLPSCTLTTIDGAWHNLLKESDPYRVVFLQKLADAVKS
jgi:lysophospholipase